MLPRWTCRLVMALLLPVLAEPALAQIPASELPGRAREQFEQPRAPLSRPGARRGVAAEHHRARGRRQADGDGPRFPHHRQHRLQRRGSRAALPRPRRPRGSGHRHLRPRAAHHREIRRRRLRAVARDRAAAGIEPARRRRAHPDRRRLYRPGRMAAGAGEVPRLLLGLCGQDHRRAADQRQDARALPAARERPARACGSPTA